MKRAFHDMPIKSIFNRALTGYEIEEFKRKAVNIAFTLLTAGVLVLLGAAVFRPPPAVPPPPGNYSTLNIQVEGRFIVPQGIKACPADEKQYIPSLVITFEMPDIPLSMEKTGKDVLFDAQGGYKLSIKDLSVMHMPECLNVKARLDGYGEFAVKGLSVPSLSSTVNVPDIVLNPEKMK